MFARYEIVLGYLGLLLHKLCSEHSLRREKEKERKRKLFCTSAITVKNGLLENSNSTLCL